MMMMSHPRDEYVVGYVAAAVAAYEIDAGVDFAVAGAAAHSTH